MPARRASDPCATRSAVLAVELWLRDPAAAEPSREALRAAVQLTARTLAALAPGRSIEVRIPPFAAVQCISGPQHRRGTPANVVETDARTWLQLATGLLGVADAAATGQLQLSGSRAAEIAQWMPVVGLDD